MNAGVGAVVMLLAGVAVWGTCERETGGPGFRVGDDIEKGSGSEFQSILHGAPAKRAVPDS